MSETILEINDLRGHLNPGGVLAKTRCRFRTLHYHYSASSFPLLSKNNAPKRLTYTTITLLDGNASTEI